MRAIIYNTLAQAEALQARVHMKLTIKGKTHGYNATRYANILEHTDGRAACPIEDRSNLAFYEALMEELTPAEKNNIEELTSDWFPNDEI